MILVVGGTGTLGERVVRRLIGAGHSVRVMTRRPQSEAAEQIRQFGADVVTGDLRNPDDVKAACTGVGSILAAAHGFPGHGTNNPRTVDRVGNRALIDAAVKAQADHFVFISILGATATHPIELFRLKHETEQYLQQSGLSYTIVRAAAFMDFWATVVGEPILKSGKTTIFGRGNNPVNFVAADDVAEFSILALKDERARGKTIEVGGPENITMNEVAAAFEEVTRGTAKKRHIPLPMMRVMSKALRPINPALATMIAAGVYMDTANQRFDAKDTLRDFPIELTTLKEFVRRRYVSQS